MTSRMCWKVIEMCLGLGIGYIEKISKNKIKWVGATDDPELENEMKSMRKEHEELQEEEKTIDHWIDYLQRTLQESYLNNPEISRYTYLTYEDFKELSKIQQNEHKVILLIFRFNIGRCSLYYHSSKGD